MSGDAKGQGFQIVIKGEGVEITKYVPPEVAQNLIGILITGDTSSSLAISPSGGELRSPAPSAATAPKVSLREFLNSVKAGSNLEVIATIGAFIEDHENESFSREDVQSRFKPAGVSPPGNFHRDFTNTIKKGWVAEDAKNPGSHYVTQTGREAVEAGFSGTKRAAPKRRTRKKAKPKSDN